MCVRLTNKLHYQFKFKRRYKLETITLKIFDVIKSLRICLSLKSRLLV